MGLALLLCDLVGSGSGNSSMVAGVFLGGLLKGFSFSHLEMFESFMSLALDGVSLCLLLGNFVSSGSGLGGVLGVASLSSFTSGFAYSLFEVFLGLVGLTFDGMS